MRLKKFILYFALTFSITLGIAIAIGSQYGGFYSMIDTIIARPTLLLGFIACSFVVGVSSISKKSKRC
jgi:hypothetical protein